MSEILQTGQHPDADQLSAFVEHTLPEHEQQQTLAHLAVCPACRQIVALSLPPAGESPAQTPTLELEPVRHRWFPRRHPAWAAIPALAALILVVLFVRNEKRTSRYTSVLSQTADARPPAPPPPPAASVQPETARGPGPLAQYSNRNRAVTAQKQLPPVMPSTREPAGANGSAGGVLGGIASPPAQTPAPAFAASSAGAPGPVTSLAVDRLQPAFSSSVSLPSHLPILSMAARGNQRLAIDTDHQVFLSEDAGRNWKAVASPWKGRAVGVALTSAVSFGSARAALKISSHPAATTGSTLSGTITDPAGAVIPGATVTAANSSGALVGSATTDSHGQYRMEDLAPGSYRIEAQATGFEKQVFAAEVAVAQQGVADLTLRPGSATQTVSITASPGAPDTSPAIANQMLKPVAGQTMSRFQLTTDDGERWTTNDGQTWTRVTPLQ